MLHCHSDSVNLTNFECGTQILEWSQIPIEAEESFAGIVDLVRMKAVVWNGEQLGAAFVDQDIPEDLLDVAEEYRLGSSTLVRS